jgi:hypothetical protein
MCLLLCGGHLITYKPGRQRGGPSLTPRFFRPAPASRGGARSSRGTPAPTTAVGAPVGSVGALVEAKRESVGWQSVWSQSSVSAASRSEDGSCRVNRRRQSNRLGRACRLGRASSIGVFACSSASWRSSASCATWRRARLSLIIVLIMLSCHYCAHYDELSLMCSLW